MDLTPRKVEIGLTPREIEIGHLVMQSRSNKEIARAIGVAEGTVKVHLTNIFRKLRISNRVGLIVFMYRGGRSP